MENRETALTRRRYDRIAPFYDLMEWLVELRFTPWRRRLWRDVHGERILEVGVGTGKNLRFHPQGAQVVALDLSAGMLAKARRRASRLGSSATLVEGDVQKLDFEDESFDCAVATFVFCSVPDPVAGLRELRRVLKPGGRLLLLEHVLSRRSWLRRLMQWLDPLPLVIWGAHIDRDTVSRVEEAGFEGLVVEPLSLDVVVRIEAQRCEEGIT